MTTWKNILTDPPEMHKTSFGLWSDTVLATDGKDVFIGNVAKEAGGLFFTGRSADCYECEELRTAEYDLTGWQWMPTAAPEKEKTADEMFGELGYKKISEKPLCTIYESKEGERIYLKFPGGRYAMNLLVYATNAPGMARELDAKEVLALARLIEEQND